MRTKSGITDIAQKRHPLKACVMLLGIALMLIMSGCAEKAVAASQKTPTVEITVPTSTSHLPDQTATTPEAFPTSTPLQSVMATPVPLVQLTFESTPTEPGSLWRPPLYKVPLALNPNDHFYFISPLPSNYEDWPVADYRYGYILPDTTTLHTGTDIKAPLHTPILAAADGKVVFAGYGLLTGAGNKEDPYGIAVVIRHNLSFQNRTILTVYAHMEKTTVQQGDWVKSGEQIGSVGLTGATTGPHLHIEIRLEDGENDNEYETQNPELWIVPPVGYGVLAGRFMTTGGELQGQKQVWVKSIDTGQIWTMVTYSIRMTRVDPYYKENFLLNNLPAGKYEISTYYFGLQAQIVEIHPGAVTFFEFTGRNKYRVGDPAPLSTDEFLTDF